MKKWLVALTLLALVVPVTAVDIYGGGLYVDGDENSGVDSAFGGEVQMRFPLGNNLALGVSAGQMRYRASGSEYSSGHRCHKSNTTVSGNINNIPLGVQALYTIPVGKVNLSVEGGAFFNLVDSDLYASTTTRRHHRTRYTTESVDPGCFWSARAGLNLEVPITEPVSLVVGGYYEMPFSDGDNGRLNQGVGAKLGLMIAL